MLQYITVSICYNGIGGHCLVHSGSKHAEIAPWHWNSMKCFDSIWSLSPQACRNHCWHRSTQIYSNMSLNTFKKLFVFFWFLRLCSIWVYDGVCVYVIHLHLRSLSRVQIYHFHSAGAFSKAKHFCPIAWPCTTATETRGSLLATDSTGTVQTSHHWCTNFQFQFFIIIVLLSFPCSSLGSMLTTSKAK